MYYSRLIRVLFVVLSFALVAKAIQPNVGRAAPTNTVAKRQIVDIGDDNNNDDESTTSEPSPTPTNGDDDDKDTTSDDKSTTTRNDDDTTSRPTRTSTSSKEEPTDGNETDEHTSTREDDNEETGTRRTSTRTKIITTTNANGQPTSFTTEDSVVHTPGLSDDDNGGGSEGMSEETRNIVIGVVVGVGGAIVIGALAFVVFRIRNRKRAAEEPDHFPTMEPMDKPDSGHGPTGHIGGPRNPFQSTLETYHAPTNVNASSNF